MEDALAHGKKVFKKDLAAKVLILVVMEDALAQALQRDWQLISRQS